MEHIKDLQTNFLRADAISNVIQEYSAQIKTNINRQINAYLFELTCSTVGDIEKLKVGDSLYPSSTATTPLGKIASINYTTSTFQLNTTQYSSSDVGQIKYLYYKRSSKDSGMYLNTPIIMGNLNNVGLTASIIIGRNNKSAGQNVLISGTGNLVSSADSHAEGSYTTVSGSSSHAEGIYTEASGEASHAEGWSTAATNQGAHAEGYDTTASGQYSHAEGQQTAASGKYSHAEGWGTIAAGYNQHVSGKYNVSDSTRFLFIIGNGTNTNFRHNAFAITWNGELVLWDSSNNEVVLTADNLRDLIALLPTT